MRKCCHGLPCSPKPSLFWPARVCRPEKQSSYGQLQDRTTHPDVFEHIGTGLPCEQAHCLHLPNWTGFEPFRMGSKTRREHLCHGQSMVCMIMLGMVIHCHYHPGLNGMGILNPYQWDHPFVICVGKYIVWNNNPCFDHG